jgi:hypothetical protein
MNNNGTLCVLYSCFVFSNTHVYMHTWVHYFDNLHVCAAGLYSSFSMQDGLFAMERAQEYSFRYVSTPHIWSTGIYIYVFVRTYEYVQKNHLIRMYRDVERPRYCIYVHLCVDMWICIIREPVYACAVVCMCVHMYMYNKRTCMCVCTHAYV